MMPFSRSGSPMSRLLSCYKTSHFKPIILQRFLVLICKVAQLQLEDCQFKTHWALNWALRSKLVTKFLITYGSKI